MADLYDELPFDSGEIAAPTYAGEPTEYRHRRHKWITVSDFNGSRTQCQFCLRPKDEARSRRGKQSRNYGNRAELHAARKYGGDKIGAAGGPVDIRGKDFDTQLKTHRRLPPLEWTTVFAKMAQGNRCPRLLLRFVQGPGVAPADFFVFPAEEFLNWFGRDEDAA